MIALKSTTDSNIENFKSIFCTLVANHYPQCIVFYFFFFHLQVTHKDSSCIETPLCPKCIEDKFQQRIETFEKIGTLDSKGVWSYFCDRKFILFFNRFVQTNIWKTRTRSLLLEKHVKRTIKRCTTSSCPIKELLKEKRIGCHIKYRFCVVKKYLLNNFRKKLEELYKWYLKSWQYKSIKEIQCTCIGTGNVQKWKSQPYLMRKLLYCFCQTKYGHCNSMDSVFKSF